MKGDDRKDWAMLDYGKPCEKHSQDRLSSDPARYRAMISQTDGDFRFEAYHRDISSDLKRAQRLDTNQQVERIKRMFWKFSHNTNRVIKKLHS